jgi:hypothetical protein
MGRKWDVIPRIPERYRWSRRPPCGYCRKRRYASRADAKKALRSIFPAEVGDSMCVYRCPKGGEWHIGHRSNERCTEWPDWTEADTERRCLRCSAVIPAGDPVAWLRGIAMCLDCGDAAEQAALPNP